MKTIFSNLKNVRTLLGWTLVLTLLAVFEKPVDPIENPDR